MTTLTLKEKSKTLSMRTNILMSMPISKYSTKVKLMMGKKYLHYCTTRHFGNIS